jgi:hypothetical protein
MLELAEQYGDPMRLAEGHLYRGLVHMYLGDRSSRLGFAGVLPTMRSLTTV